MRRRYLWIGVSVLGAVGVLAALWAIPDLEERPLVIRLDDVVPVRRDGLPDALRFAVAPVFSAEGTAQGFEPLARIVGRLLHRPVRIVQRRSYAEINTLLREGSVHFALICAGAWLQARHEGQDLEVLVVPYHGDSPTYRSYTIVRADAGISSMAELSGRTFAFTDPLSLSGHFHPLEWALGAGRRPRDFFRDGTFTYSHARSIDAVLSGRVDGAAVSSRVWEAEVRRRPELVDRLRILHRSEPLGANPVVAPRSTGATLMNALRRAFVRLSESGEGRLALERVGITRFVVPPSDPYAADEERFTALMRHLEAKP